MTVRNLSPQTMFAAMGKLHTPRYAFSSGKWPDFATWKAAATPEVIATLGQLPPIVPLNPERLAVWDDDGIVKERWLIDVGPGIAAPLITARRADIPDGMRLPTLFCAHGHGPFGKEPVMSRETGGELGASIRAHNYNFGHQMAQRGYLTFTMDWMGFGERDDRRIPAHQALSFGRDWCNLYYLHATMLGMTPLGMHITHGKQAVTFMQTHPFADPDRFGMMGISGGGTLTTWMGFCDERLKAIEIICYSDRFADFGFSQINYCGMQITPGLFTLVDVPDLQGLIAPKPLLIDIGEKDTCFRVDSAMSCYRELETIYRAAGVSDRLQLDLFDGEHAWGNHHSEDFFGRWL